MQTEIIDPYSDIKQQLEGLLRENNIETSRKKNDEWNDEMRGLFNRVIDLRFNREHFSEYFVSFSKVIVAMTELDFSKRIEIKEEQEENIFYYISSMLNMLNEELGEKVTSQEIDEELTKRQVHYLKRSKEVLKKFKYWKRFTSEYPYTDLAPLFSDLSTFVDRESITHLERTWNVGAPRAMERIKKAIRLLSHQSYHARYNHWLKEGEPLTCLSPVQLKMLKQKWVYEALTEQVDTIQDKLRRFEYSHSLTWLTEKIEALDLPEQVSSFLNKEGITTIIDLANHTSKSLQDLGMTKKMFKRLQASLGMKNLSFIISDTKFLNLS